MTIIRTDLRNTREAAHEIRSQSFGAITAVDVQSALEQITTTPKSISPTNISSVNSPYAVLVSDTLLLVDTAGGAVTINLPAQISRGGVPLTIKDSTGHNPISVVPIAGETIDLTFTNAAPYLIDSNFGAARFGPETGGYFIDA